MNKKQEYKDLIVELANLFRPKVYVEIGAKSGYVFNAVAPFCDLAVAVDIRLSGIKRSKNILCFEQSSQNFATAWNKEIDLLFIDGDHSEQAVFNDFLLLSRFIKPYTGLILLHDTYPIKEEL